MQRHAMCWLPDRADFRNHTAADSGVARRLKTASVPKGAKALPKRIDLRPWCSPVEDQGELGSCTAQDGGGGIAQVTGFALVHGRFDPVQPRGRIANRSHRVFN